MRIWKQNILILLFIIIMLVFSYTASAMELDDASGDVYHHTFYDNTWSWIEFAGEKQSVDIDKLTYSISGTTLTVTLELYGDIQDSTSHVYSVIYIDSESSGIYTFSYVNGIGTALGISQGGFATGEFTKSGNILTGTIEISGEEVSPSVFGVAAEYLVDYTTITDPETIEYYTDYVPASLAPWYIADAGDGDGDGDGDGGTGNGDATSDEEKKDGGTPGFELIALVAAIAVALILLKRRK